MISKRIYSPQTVTLTATVAVVAGEKPLIGFSDDVEKKWRTLKKKHKIREKRKGAEKPAKLARVSSAGDLLDGANAALGQEGPRRSSTVSSVQNLMSKFKEIEATSRSESQYDVYSASYIPKRYSKMSPEYGRPKPGSLTEKRAQKACFKITHLSSLILSSYSSSPNISFLIFAMISISSSRVITSSTGSSLLNPK
ncbi:hypothetical protein L596_008823 [Steinernema carpocapsae]|uniref:Uncharacterized protein n=1 Tax=Steinernema carpocapsae TaxID=34508 RepID=A0A4V6A6E2_STECR|nr:hypothetical protein L596_008823 [Steinernema carpocapsae]